MAYSNTPEMVDSQIGINLKTVTRDSISLTANQVVSIDFTNVLNSGETYLGCVGVRGSGTSNTVTFEYSFYPTENRLRVYIINLSSSAKTITNYKVDVLYKIS